jgi:glycosyltransferase involved in cell wall biosynthesis
MDKKISIIISAWNVEKYIGKAIDAIKKQPVDKIELIIVNDGSTDKTEDVIIDAKKHFDKEGRTLTLINQTNQGVGAAFNRAIKRCTGDYLYWQDADDWLEEGALKDMAEYLDQHSDATMVRGDRFTVYENGSTNKHKELVVSQKPKNNNVFKNYIFEKDVICFTGIFMVRMEEVHRRIGDRGIFISSFGQNWQLILPLSYKNKCGYIDRPIINYLVRQDSHSHSAKTIKEQIARTRAHEKILTETIKRIGNMSAMSKTFYKIAIKMKYIEKRQRLRVKNIVRRIK